MAEIQVVIDKDLKKKIVKFLFANPTYSIQQLVTEAVEQHLDRLKENERLAEMLKTQAGNYSCDDPCCRDCNDNPDEEII